MQSKEILPKIAIGIGEISGGTVVDCHKYCMGMMGNVQNIKCSSYYEDILNKPGIHTCPYGFNSFVLKDDRIHEIFTSLKIRNKYDKKKIAPKVIREDQSREVTEEQLSELIELYKRVEKLEHDYEEADKFVKDIMHEIRNFNSKIISKSEQISSGFKNKKDKVKSRIKDEKVWIQNIYSLSNLIEARFLAFDCTVNPESLTFGDKRGIEIHKKFFKAMVCCEDEANNKNIRIRVGSNNTIISLYSSFDLVPFLLIDNAIKYSPNESEINIEFNEGMNYVNVKISSVGPYVSQEELKHICDRGVRANSVINKPGSGIGLFLVKAICEIHQAQLNIDFKAIDGLKENLGMFEVSIKFEK